MLNDSLIDKLQYAALSYLETHLDKRYTYHNAAHTLAVCNAVKLFAEASGLPLQTYFSLRIAAVFHDFGYLEQSFDNEKLARPYLEEFGRKFGIDEKFLLQANDLILETVFPYTPLTPAGSLLCDADIEYIGRECFFQHAGLFRQELAGDGIVYTDEQWWEMETGFLQDNKFFTPVCRRLRNVGRLNNLKTAQEYLLAAREECCRS